MRKVPELQGDFCGHRGMKKISKWLVLFAAFVAVPVLLVWKESVREPRIERKPVASAARLMPEKIQETMTSAAPSRKLAKTMRPKTVAHAKEELKLGLVNLPVDDSKNFRATPGKNALPHLALAKEPEDIDIDLGKNLPWPAPKSPLLLPGNRETGFHVGVNFRLDKRWDLAGVAGVGVPGGIQADQLKPNVEQVGILARYRF